MTKNLKISYNGGIFVEDIRYKGIRLGYWTEDLVGIHADRRREKVYDLFESSEDSNTGSLNWLREYFNNYLWDHFDKNKAYIPRS